MFSRNSSTSTSRTSSSHSHELAIIHDHRSQRGEIRIKPFQYQLYQLDGQLIPLLHIPGQLLLQVTSTSPDHESECFCSDLRRTLSFLNEVPSQDVFGQCGSQPLDYARSISVGRSNSLCNNQWEGQQSV